MDSWIVNGTFSTMAAADDNVTSALPMATSRMAMPALSDPLPVAALVSGLSVFVLLVTVLILMAVCKPCPAPHPPLFSPRHYRDHRDTALRDEEQPHGDGLQYASDNNAFERTFNSESPGHTYVASNMRASTSCAVVVESGRSETSDDTCVFGDGLDNITKRDHADGDDGGEIFGRSTCSSRTDVSSKYDSENFHKSNERRSVCASTLSEDEEEARIWLLALDTILEENDGITIVDVTIDDVKEDEETNHSPSSLLSHQSPESEAETKQESDDGTVFHSCSEGEEPVSILVGEDSSLDAVLTKQNYNLQSDLSDDLDETITPNEDCLLQNQALNSSELRDVPDHQNIFLAHKANSLNYKSEDFDSAEDGIGVHARDNAHDGRDIYAIRTHYEYQNQNFILLSQEYEYFEEKPFSEGINLNHTSTSQNLPKKTDSKSSKVNNVSSSSQDHLPSPNDSLHTRQISEAVSFDTSLLAPSLPSEMTDEESRPLITRSISDAELPRTSPTRSVQAPPKPPRRSLPKSSKL